MATTPVTTSKIYKPAMLVGRVYARAYGASTPHIPIGNVLKTGAGAQRRCHYPRGHDQAGRRHLRRSAPRKEVAIKMELADLNTTNLQRALLGTSAAVDGRNHHQ